MTSPYLGLVLRKSTGCDTRTGFEAFQTKEEILISSCAGKAPSIQLPTSYF
ncbi:hypothetical protein C943_04379 [Mariniradius saccharolyticus AK6]|uniref:Uncharacterized protein n=1 Tax=Mariniradius saccharolyticus AK6 TaxID=1239962 RepID=M7Y8J2_9BACT|nr:hypothetical protein C943_04379 [Mariniradius saccharolyticus AK6]